MPSSLTFAGALGKKAGHQVYIAPIDRIAEVKDEITSIVLEKNNFLVTEGTFQKSYWAQNIWKNAEVVEIESIKKAAQFLKSIQRNWWHFSLENIRRTKLIQDLLPSLKHKPIPFPSAIPQSPLGSFALLSENQMIYSPDCTSPIPNGEFIFKAPSYETPSEAYLKLWEALYRMGKAPQAGDLCVDLGSSPGSWTQALLKLGVKVISVDKAALNIPNEPQLSFLKKDAFKLKPQEIEKPAWIFSDLICYPDKLYELAMQWRTAHPKAHFVFTLKFQKKWDKRIVEELEAMPQSQILHLFHNKHELCWINFSKTS